MSKRFESKKEAAVTLQRFYSALDGKADKDQGPSDNDYKYKYNLLLKRFHELEKVFDFHRGIIQQISSGLLTTDMEGHITFMNRTALDMFGYDYLEIQGAQIVRLFADPQEGKSMFDNVLKGHMYESKEIYLLDKKGQPIPAGFSTSLLQNAENKEPEGVVFIFRNITAMNNLRRQIERMERLATLGELSAGIAHEIRNPLAGIKTSAQVLEESFAPGDFRAQLVTRIVKEIDRSNELLKRFFNFAKPSKPSQEFHDIEMIIDGVYLLLAPRLKKKGITFNTQFAADTPRVYVDASQIEQVILNLFLNALDALSQNGEIRVKTAIVENVKFDHDRSGQSAVEVQVADNGQGIPKKIQEKIFNPFFTTKSNGLGLGLSISTRLMEENGGKIELHSGEGKGSTFKLYFPINESQNNRV